LKLALFPPPGGGLYTLRQTGQLSRLTDYYLPIYSQNFDRIFYFSYLNESLLEYGVEQLVPKVQVIGNESKQTHHLYTFTMTGRQAQWIRQCAVSRVFQATGVIPAWQAKRRWLIPLVTTYGYRYAAFARAEGRWLGWAYALLLERLAWRVSDAVIVTTAELLNELSGRVAPDRLHLIPNGVDVEQFRPLPSRPEADPPSILFVGRLAVQKNLTTLVQAVAKLRPTLPIRLDFVGEGPLRQELEQQCAALDIQARFHGTISHASLPGFYQRATIFALPSLIEGHPKVLLEAMACGMAIVASNAPGNREVIENGVNGLLFPIQDVDKLADCLSQVILKPEFAQQFRHQARKTAVSKFNIHHALQKEVALLQEQAKGTKAL
jgi:glycosyltransferase involved in cell wall biosynthesis